MSRTRAVVLLLLFVAGSAMFYLTDPFGWFKRTRVVTKVDGSVPVEIEETTSAVIDSTAPSATPPPRSSGITTAPSRDGTVPPLAAPSSNTGGSTTSAPVQRTLGGPSTTAAAAETTSDGGGGDDGGSRLPLKCYRRRIYYSPVICSRLALFIKQIVDKEPDRASWRLMHVGNVDAQYKIGEVVDLFSPVAPSASYIVGEAALAANPQLNSMSASAASITTERRFSKVYAPLCGKCCECVAQVYEVRDKIKVSPSSNTSASRVLSVAGVVPKSLHVAPLASDKHLKLFPFPEAQQPDLSRPFDTACQEHITAFAAVLNRMKGVDWITVDAGPCDVQIIQRLMPRLRRFGEGGASPADPAGAGTSTNRNSSMAVPLSPQLIQFTMKDDEADYKSLLKQLSAQHQYSCGFFSQKPEHRKLRGVRPPVYPVFIRLDGCWRPSYDLLRKDRFHLTCWDATDTTVVPIVEAYTRSVHKGMDLYCSKPYEAVLRNIDERRLASVAEAAPVTIAGATLTAKKAVSRGVPNPMLDE